MAAIIYLYLYMYIYIYIYVLRWVGVGVGAHSLQRDYRDCHCFTFPDLSGTEPQKHTSNQMH